MTINTRTVTYSASDTEHLTQLLGTLSIEEKVLLLTGRDFWTTWPIERIGLRALLLSDGPSGVRGESWDERSPSLNLPSATALAAAWDPGLARRYGNVVALEARRKGVDVVLGPTVNLHRSPLGGRNFECFSEDPMLTSRLAAAYVSGVQEHGVGATLKHYVANDFETDRFTVDVRVCHRALREVYLLAFEDAVREAGAWLVMSSYNSINGETATESDLLETPLNAEWGFDGVVVSDWTAVRTLESARHSQDLVMPGPNGPWGSALVTAVQRGQIDERAIDRKVLRILRLAARVGALDGIDSDVAGPAMVEDGEAFAREAEVAGTVLARNTGELPWSAESLSSVAVIGYNAKFARTQGGGSATVIPAHVISPLEGITRALPDATVTYSMGAVVQQGIAAFPLGTIVNPETDAPGARVRFLHADGSERFAENRESTSLIWFRGDEQLKQASVLEISLRYTAEATGETLVGFAAVGTGRILVNGDLRREHTMVAASTDLGAAFLAPPSCSVPVHLVEGEVVDLRVELDLGSAGSFEGALSITLGIEIDSRDDDRRLAEAVAAARAADVAVVVVGTNSAVESEGFDRESLRLPGRQDDLVRAVAAANPRTVVVVNSGAPVLLPWRDEVSAILLSWFGGQEYGAAIADMLLGIAEPGGRLPTTWPAEQTETPVIDVTPVDGVVEYEEGIHIGYRAWLKSGAHPAYEFGHGLGFTDFAISDVRAPATVCADWAFEASTLEASTFAASTLATNTVELSASVSNTGARAGKAVVQVYAERADSAVDRPVRWLVGFAALWIEPGRTDVARITVPVRAFAHWDDGWHFEAGPFVLRVGTSVSALPAATTIELVTVDAGSIE